MMTIKVKFFASLREEVERSEVDLKPQGEMTVAQVWALACQDMPLPEHILSAVNLEYVSADTAVKDGDEVAFFPPVTGG